MAHTDPEYLNRFHFSDDSLHDKTAMFLLTRTRVGAPLMHLESELSE
jgi:hypothetical protein